MVSAFGLTWTPSLYVVPTFLAAVAAAGLAVYAWRHRDRRTALPFVAMMVGLFVWSLGYGLQLGFASRGPMLALDKVAFVGSVVAPTAWFVLALEYAGYEAARSKRVLGALAVEPVLTLGLVWTNELHGLVWREVGVDASGPLAVLELTFGPAYWLNFAYSYLLVVGGVLVLGRVVLHANRVHRWQSLLLVVGAVVPLGANAVFNLVPALNPISNLDLTTSAFAATAAVYALVLYRYRLLDLVPAARERLVERMDDGVLVLADDGRIVDSNPAARAALADGGEIGHVAEIPIAGGDGVVGGLVTLDVDGESRTYDVVVTSISDFRGEEAGQFVIMHDITQLEVLQVQEQRLSVLNRILRHNIRNEVNVISGRIELIADELDESSPGHVEPMERAVERILSMSDQSRYVESAITGQRPEGTRVDVVDACRRMLEDAAAAYPDAEFEWHGPDEAVVGGVDREHFERVVVALLENAIEHNHSDPPVVEVTVEAGPAEVRLRVADNGPGIPELEQSVRNMKRETPLEHGAGLGLWLVKWIVEAADGEIDFAESDLGGSEVRVTLPAAASAVGSS